MKHNNWFFKTILKILKFYNKKKEKETNSGRTNVIFVCWICLLNLCTNFMKYFW